MSLRLNMKFIDIIVLPLTTMYSIHKIYLVLEISHSAETLHFVYKECGLYCG